MMGCKIVSGHSEAIRLVKASSENPFTSSSRVDFSEGSSSYDVQSSLGLKATVLIESISSHTSLESDELRAAHLFKDGLTRRTFIFTGESRINKNHKPSAYDLPCDSIINESRLLGGTTEHVAHIFHWHMFK